MMNLVQSVRQHNVQRAQEVFCHFIKNGETTDITFHELFEGACMYANLYREKGLKPGDVVLVILDHRPDLLYAFIGALFCGCIPSFMPFPSIKQDPVLYWASHRELFTRIGAGALVTYPENEQPLRQNIADLPLRLLMPEQAQDQPRSFEPCDPDLDAVAFLQHSSGTTGLKKGVALSYRAVKEQIDSYSGVLSLDDSDCFATWLPLYHDMGLIACFILPLTLGLPIAFLDPFEWVSIPSLLFETIEKYQCTYAWLPNFSFHHLCRTKEPGSSYNLSSLKALIDCSEPCKPETFDLFLDTFGSSGIRRSQLQVCYAMAETVFAVTQTRLGEPVRSIAADNEEILEHQRIASPHPGKPARRFLSVGAPIPGIEARIEGSQGEILPDGQIGEVTAKGKFLFSGYFRLEEETHKSIRDGWYHTGDMGFLKDGELYITGRKKDMIIVHGQNFYAHDIEYIVNGVEGIKPGRSVAMGVFVQDVGSEEAAIVSETEIADPSGWPELSRRIKKEVLNKLNLTLLDAKIVSPGWLVKTTSGKISRKENLRKYLEEKAPKQGVSGKETMGYMEA